MEHAVKKERGKNKNVNPILAAQYPAYTGNMRLRSRQHLL